MVRWLRRLHLYTGLLTCTSLFTFGVAGLGATWLQAGGARPETLRSEVPFAATPGESDRAVAERIHALHAPPLALPLEDWAIERKAGKPLRVVYFTPRLDRTITWHERRGVLEIESRPLRWPVFMDRMHAVSWIRPTDGVDWRLLVWSAYVELSIYALLFLVVTGVALWAATRPRHRAAQLSLAAGSAAFALVYWMAV